MLSSNHSFLEEDLNQFNRQEIRTRMIGKLEKKRGEKEEERREKKEKKVEREKKEERTEKPEKKILNLPHPTKGHRQNCYILDWNPFQQERQGRRRK